MRSVLSYIAIHRKEESEFADAGQIHASVNLCTASSQMYPRTGNAECNPQTDSFVSLESFEQHETALQA